jgi:hypothetical protein
MIVRARCTSISCPAGIPTMTARITFVAAVRVRGPDNVRWGSRSR